MKDFERQRLKTELQEAGATTAEIQELVQLASRLDVLKTSTVETPKDKTKTSSWMRLFKPVSFAASGFVLGLFLVIIAQTVSPTSMLYPIQKLSDNAAVRIHPPYRSYVMMKRAQQVNELVAQHASSKQVLATLADYTKQASTYKSASYASYAAFDYCKTYLTQAATNASPDVRQAITSSLQSLENT